MAYETFELRFEGCNHTMKIPLLHNQDDSRCFVVQRGGMLEELALQGARIVGDEIVGGGSERLDAV